jgi:hypothetical protein
VHPGLSFEMQTAPVPQGGTESVMATTWMAGADFRIKSGDGHDVGGVIQGGRRPGRGAIPTLGATDSLPHRSGRK